MYTIGLVAPLLIQIMKAKIHYKNLIVNPDNYRFDSVDNQEQAIDTMLQEKGDEIFNMSKHIVEHGLDQARDFRVLKKGENEYLVLDGNRRATALKCLHDTSIIKNKKIKLKFEKLAIDKKKIPKEIQSYIYNSEKDAAKWIKLDHTGKNDGIGQDSWGAPEKDRFSYKFEGKLSPAMQAVQLVEDSLKIKFETKNLKISTINRIFSNPESRSYIGIDIKNKKVILITEKDEAIKRLHTLFRKIIDDQVKVDSVYTTGKSIKFMVELFGDKPEPKKRRLFPVSATTNLAPSANTEKQGRSDRKPLGLFFKSDVPYKLGVRQLQKLYDELSDPDILNYPNATHDLLRSFLECSLVAYLKHEKIKKYNECLSDRKKNQKNITLTDMLTFLSSKKTTIIKDDNVKKIAKQLISDDNQLYSVERMNLVNHNENWFSTKKDVKSVWEKIEPLFKVILNPSK